MLCYIGSVWRIQLSQINPFTVCKTKTKIILTCHCHGYSPSARYSGIFFIFLLHATDDILFLTYCVF